jgi:membrane protease YdiL (CAAX protease family)
MDDRRSALLALSVFAIDRAAVSVLNLLRAGMSQATRMAYLNLTTLVFVWGLPLLAVYRVEGRGAESLGLRVPRERYPRYAIYCFVGFILPSAFLGYPGGFASELLEQIAFIGLAEEFFYRGYLMTRLCGWLGERKGLILNAVVFSLAHATFLLTRYGLSEAALTLTSVAQTFLGGILMGYVYLRSGNIVPGTVLHISMNVWLSRL